MNLGCATCVDTCCCTRVLLLADQPSANAILQIILDSETFRGIHSRLPELGSVVLEATQKLLRSRVGPSAQELASMFSSPPGTEWLQRPTGEHTHQSHLCWIDLLGVTHTCSNLPVPCSGCHLVWCSQPASRNCGNLRLLDVRDIPYPLSHT